jgi:hypothetical protein
MVSNVEHEPSMSEYQSFATGQQRVHMMVAETPRMMFTERMMNQINHFSHPSERRKRVMANEVLLQAAARMAAKPAEYDIRELMGILVGSTSWECMPMPNLVPSVSMADETRMQICHRSARQVGSATRARPREETIT